MKKTARRAPWARCGARFILNLVGIVYMATLPLGAAPSHAATPAASAPSTAKVRPREPAPIDINSASLSELETLPGIDAAQARRIIKHRPYHTKAELVTAKATPAGVFQSIRHRIIAIQPIHTRELRPGTHP